MCDDRVTYGADRNLTVILLSTTARLQVGFCFKECILVSSSISFAKSTDGLSDEDHARISQRIIIGSNFSEKLEVTLCQ
jgi:hypothetical protein